MRLLALVLSPLIALNPLWAQTNNSGAALADSQAALHAHLIEDPVPAHANSTSAKGYIVQVTTPTGSPVASAAVAVRLPEQGPSGRFSDGLRAWVAYTDAAGIATFPAIHWSEGAGISDIRVTVAKGISHTGLIIAQQVTSENGETGVLAGAAVKPPLPATPQIALNASQTATENKPLADVVPPSPAALPGKPAQHPLKPDSSSASDKKTPGQEPTVTITNTPTGAGTGAGNGGRFEGRKKWLVLGSVAAAAGLGAVLALSGKGGAAAAGTPSSSGVTIGGPTVSLGH